MTVTGGGQTRVGLLNTDAYCLVRTPDPTLSHENTKDTKLMGSECQMSVSVRIGLSGPCPTVLAFVAIYL